MRKETEFELQWGSVRRGQTWAGHGWLQLPQGMAEPTNDVASQGKVFKTLNQLKGGGITKSEKMVFLAPSPEHRFPCRLGKISHWSTWISLKGLVEIPQLSRGKVEGGIGKRESTMY